MLALSFLIEVQRSFLIFEFATGEMAAVLLRSAVLFDFSAANYNPEWILFPARHAFRYLIIGTENNELLIVVSNKSEIFFGRSFAEYIQTQIMALTENQRQQIQLFFNQSRFDDSGAVITDLDGTAIHEFEGQYSIPKSVELGLEKIYALGRPVVLNTLRFPLSVIRTFGKEWYKISNSSIPTVLMNGSQLGYLKQQDGAYVYDEIMAFVLDEQEIKSTISLIIELNKDNIDDLLVFYYPRDWKCGEIIWTPVRSRIKKVQTKYLSASKVFSSSVSELEDELSRQQICMIFILIDIPQDKLMAYQHTKRNNFITHQGVDKKYGAEKIAEILGFDLKHSVGAGDSEMDTFLNAVGLAVHVGNPYLTFEGMMPPVKLNNSTEFGELLFQLAAMQRNTLAIK